MLLRNISQTKRFNYSFLMRHTSLFFQQKQLLKTDKEILSAIKAGVVTEKKPETKMAADTST